MSRTSAPAETATRRHGWASAGDAAVAAVCVFSVWIAVTGGIRFDLGGIRWSMRDWMRPMALFFGLVCLRLALIARRTPAGDRPFAISSYVARTGYWVLALLMPTLWLVYLDMACGGLDSHGYVSAAALLSSGHLSTSVDTSWLPFSGAISSLAPLGWVPGPDGVSIVPRFPLGLPMAMASFRLAFGANGPFYVSPVLAIVTVVATHVLVARVTQRPLSAGLAALLIATHPVVFMSGIQPMSDVPATCYVVLAAMLMMSERPRALAGGMVIGLGILTRPTLALAALALPFAARARLGATLRYLLVVALCVGALLALQWRMYGHPFASGYGSAEQLFTRAMFWRNVVAYTKWLVIVHTPALVLLLIACWQFGSRRLLGLSAVMFLAVAAPYTLYVYQADEWGMLRFLLPGVVFLLMAAADGAVTAFARVLPRSAVPVAALAMAGIVAAGSVVYLQRQGIFRVWSDEARYPEVGAWFSANTAPDAVVLASLHSGSIHYYSGRLTLRWDQIPPESLPATIGAIARRGGSALLALDGDDERGEFTRRFNGQVPSQVHVDLVDRLRAVDVSRLTLAR